MSRTKRIESNVQASNPALSDEQVSDRAASIAAGYAYAESAAEGLSDGDLIGVEASASLSGELTAHVGHVSNGRLVINGVLGMRTGRRLTLPYRTHGGDFPSVGELAAVLADGTEVRYGEMDGGCWRYVANGRTYPTVLAAAIELTPA